MIITENCFPKDIKDAKTTMVPMPQKCRIGIICPKTIRINSQLKRHITDCYKAINPIGINAPILVSQKGTIFTIQRINVILKELKKNIGCILITLVAIRLERPLADRCRILIVIMRNLL